MLNSVFGRLFEMVCDEKRDEMKARISRKHNSKQTCVRARQSGQRSVLTVKCPTTSLQNYFRIEIDYEFIPFCMKRM